LLHQFVQPRLERFEAFLQQHDHEHGEGQPAPPGKILGPTAMPGAERRVQEAAAKFFDESQSTFF
jgi:hypothetical protein